jgi:DNA-binding response OmpR family regulator
MRILIIEDDRDAAACLVKAFREAGYSVDYAAARRPPPFFVRGALAQSARQMRNRRGRNHCSSASAPRVEHPS